MTAITRDTCGIVLAGGRSTRMGQDKASLPWGNTTMLETVVATLRGELPHVIVVAASGQELPTVDADVVRDPVPAQGPLRGLATGLAAAAAAGHEWAFATATDVPMLSASVIRLLARPRVDPGVDAVLATADGRHQPLVGAYRTALAGEMAEALAAGVRSPLRFLASRSVHTVPVAESLLFNINTPADLEKATEVDRLR